MKLKRLIIYYKILFFTFLLSSCTEENNSVDWPVYLGDHHSSQYSELIQINAQNVNQLKTAWTYNAAEPHPNNRSQIQCNPLVVSNVLYGTSATQKVFALDASDGRLLWQFDPYNNNYDDYGMGVSRGLIYHDQKIFFSSGPFVFSLDANNGEKIESFGIDGKIDLRRGLSPNDDFMVYANTPGVIFKNKLIIGGRVSESTNAAAGHIRAFDIDTGELIWTFHTIPKPNEFGYHSWPKDAHARIGGANVWTGMALDSENGIVYCPTGSASYDFYGGDRAGDNLFANCLIALDANTGKRIWHFQTVHHDIWDRDLPSPPNLIQLNKGGKEIPAIVQTTKNGFIFIFDRLSGEPLYPINEVDVPTSQLKGEINSKTQPVPAVFPNFSRLQLTKNDLANRNEEAASYAHAIWSSSYYNSGLFDPPSESGTILFPGFDGGAEWGGAAYDPIENHLVVNSNEVPWRITMDEIKPATKGERLYKVLCQNCHGQSFEGNSLYGNIPSLINLKSHISLSEASITISLGKGIMPAFGHLEQNQIEAIYNYINGEDITPVETNKDWPYPYSMRGYEKLLAPDGFPIITPPWGQLTSINLDSATINWQIPLGTHQELLDQGLPPTGTENYGGPIITKGGLIFIAATMDEKIRAFDKKNGKLLWEAPLPAAGYATPATYMIDGKQYVVIACGGGKLGTKSGDSYVAFSL